MLAGVQRSVAVSSRDSRGDDAYDSVLPPGRWPTDRVRRRISLPRPTSRWARRCGDWPIAPTGSE